MFTLIGAIIAVIITGLCLWTSALNNDPVRIALFAAFAIGTGIVVDWLLGRYHTNG